MKDSMSAAEVGTGQYATTKGISQTNLITTVTPEKKAEEEHGEEEDRRKKAEEATPVPALRLEGKVQLLAASLSCPHLYKQLSGSETVDWGGGGTRRWGVQTPALAMVMPGFTLLLVLFQYILIKWFS